MIYYFTLSKENVKNFYSSNWLVLGEGRVFGGGVIIKTPNDINKNKLFRCTLLRSSDTRTLFEIDLSEDDIHKTAVSADGWITLIKLTNDKNVKDWTCTLLHYTTEFFDLTPNGYSLKGMLPITKPEWSWDYRPLTMKTTVDSNKSENDFMNEVHKEFIQAYSRADSKINMMGVLKDMSMFESDKRVRIPEIKEVIFNKPATVVYWKDGTKITVKCGNDEESFDREKAVAMCFLKKMLKPSLNSHWLDVINDAIQAADDKVAQAEAAKAEKARIKAENIAKAEEARRKKAEKKVKELQSEIQKLETKSLEEMDSEVEEKDEFEEKYKDVPVKASKNKVSEEYVEKIFDQAEKENKKWAAQANDKGEKKKIDQDLLLECIKEKLTIDEIAEMNSWDKAAVARMYYKITGIKPEKKPNTYSELDALFEQGVSVDAAARRTGFSKNIVAMRYAKLQNKNNIKE